MLLSDIFVRSEVKYSNYLPGSSFRRSKSVGAKIIIVSQMRVKIGASPRPLAPEHASHVRDLCGFGAKPFILPSKKLSSCAGFNCDFEARARINFIPRDKRDMRDRAGHCPAVSRFLNPG